MAEGYFNVTIRTKPYLKKYLQTLYGDPIIFTTRNLLGIIIAPLLKRPVKFQHSTEVLQKRAFKFADTLEIKCHKRFIRHRKFGIFINDRQAISVNLFFENQFREDLWKFCRLMSFLDVEITDAIEEFCTIHGIVIDEDITMDAIVQKERRFRRLIEENAPQLSAKKKAPKSHFSKD
jgi:hypothetical protein